MENTKSVGIWIRVSTEDQARGDSPEHHEHRARSYAELRGWTVIEVYHLEGLSGKSVMEYPEAKRMMEDIRSGKISGLIFSKLARLARNTKELLDFSDFFETHKADLISLQEAIDTSTPAGRLFYTILAAMAQWEREEIADRVRASVPIRAKLGKPLGGAAPYGYQWKNKELVLDEKEAPIRRRMFELYLKHKRKKTVASTLNNEGYRTRKGANWSNTTITRLLRDPLAKGLRRANYTQSLGEGKNWKLKPQEEWVFTEAPAVVPTELWNQVNAILDAQEVKRPPSKRVAHLFSGYAVCHCGGKMYVPSKNPKYTCQKCKNKIGTDDLEEIYQSQLRSYLVSPEQIQNQLQQVDTIIKEKERQLVAMQNEVVELIQQLDRLVELYQAGELPKVGFGKHYTPLHERREQIETSIPQLEAEIDYLKVQLNSSDQILFEARNLYDRWTEFSFEQKRRLIEMITKDIIIDTDSLEINLRYLGRDPPFPKGLQKGNTPLPLRLLQSPGQRLCLRPEYGAALPLKNLRSAHGPHRPAHRGYPRPL